ncbi:MAG: guanylate kinase [Alphaproteobacteria bacterium]|nr:guanylate kinase [Alphaproteobacteria bacterium]MBR3501708.1 guanylate kinase [Alphaproteobacteria bacterium]
MADILQQLNSVRRGLMLILGGPSGTGKTSVVKKMLEQDKNISWSVSVTTRAPREGEKNGVDYYYVTDEQYDKYLQENAFYEHVDSQYGCRYGTLRSEVDGFINVGKDVIFDMDQEGFHQMRAKAPQDVVSVFLLPPSIKELRRRLEGRKTDSKEVIDKRMNMAMERLKYWNEYDYAVICLDLDQAVETVQHILSAERMKRERQLGLIGFTEQLMKDAKEVQNG